MPTEPITKQAIIDYYAHIHADRRLIIIDETDTRSSILEKLNECVQNNNDPSAGTIHIVTFKNNKKEISYSLTVLNGGKYALYQNMDEKAQSDSLEDIADAVVRNMPDHVMSPYEKYIDSKNADGSYIIRSFINDKYVAVLRPDSITDELYDSTESHILGVFMNSDGDTEFRPINHIDATEFTKLAEPIQNPKVKLFVETIAKIIPSYVFAAPVGIPKVTASAEDLFPGGLMRKIARQAEIFRIIMSSQYSKIKFGQDEIDKMYAAVLLSDILLCGWDYDYSKPVREQSDHPKLAADLIRGTRGILKRGDLQFIANCVESHTGGWNMTENKAMLPNPDNDPKYIVHLACILCEGLSMRDANPMRAYIFANTPVIKLKKMHALSEENLNEISCAINIPVDMSLAERLGITADEDEILNTWQDIIKRGSAYDDQAPYEMLAKKMLENAESGLGLKHKEEDADDDM